MWTLKIELLKFSFSIKNDKGTIFLACLLPLIAYNIFTFLYLAPDVTELISLINLTCCCCCCCCCCCSLFTHVNTHFHTLMVGEHQGRLMYLVFVAFCVSLILVLSKQMYTVAIITNCYLLINMLEVISSLFSVFLALASSIHGCLVNGRNAMF